MRGETSRRRRSSRSPERKKREKNYSIEEYHVVGSSRSKQSYQINETGWHLKTPIASKPSSSPLFQSFWNQLETLVLPTNYPDSVTRDYLRFQIFDTIQALCSYLRGTLCTQALMLGVGVGVSTGDEVATATNAAIQWAFLDGAGMLGSVLFAWGYASVFGEQPKFWRLFADVINDIGLALALIAPLFRKESHRLFLLIAATGSVCRAICGVAAGATRVALTQHFACGRIGHGIIRDTVAADIAAKENVQETLTVLIGLVTGSLVAHFLQQSQTMTWLVFFILTAIHVLANYNAVRVLCLTSFDQQRAYLVIDHYLETQGQQILSPEVVSQKEAIWYRAPFQFITGISLRTIASNGSEVQSILQDQPSLASSNFLLAPVPSKSKSDTYTFLGSPSGYYVVLSSSAEHLNSLEAFFYACLHYRRSHNITEEDEMHSFADFCSALEPTPWRLTNSSFRDKKWRCSWTK